MKFSAYCRRLKGSPLLGAQRGRLQTGELALVEEREDTLGRTVKVARLMDGRKLEVFPALIEAQVLRIDAGEHLRLILAGLERDDLTRCDRAQTWVLQATASYTFWAYRRRRGGSPIPRWQLPMVTWAQGSITLCEQRDPVLGRTVRVARLTNSSDSDVFPPLLEAQVLQIYDAEIFRIVIAGLERDSSTRCDTAQTWVLQTHNDPKVSTETDRPHCAIGYV